MTTTILVVEDDPAVAGMLEMTLAVEGYETEVLARGDEVVARLDGATPDLVVLDVMLPGNDGFEVLERLRETPGWEEIPVVVCTALGDDQSQWEAWSRGADYVLAKPFDLDGFRTLVGKLLVGDAVL